jgi:hypothetical protein
MWDTYARDTGSGRSWRCAPALVAVVTAAVVVAVACLAVAGCSSITHPSATTASGTVSGTVDAAPTTVPRDIQQVCTRFVVAALSVDTTTDRGPADARIRAANTYGVPELAARLQGNGKDPAWPLLVAHRAHVHVSTQPVGDDPPPAQGDTAAAGVHATRVAVGTEGWRQRLSDTVAYCSLRRQPEGWKVTDLSFSDSPSTSRARR